MIGRSKVLVVWLLAVVGSALADYLQRARPDVEDRSLSLRQCAPIRGISETGTIRSVLARACARAGIAYGNPHQLRHTMASEMLQAGVPLCDIGQELGHRGVCYGLEDYLEHPSLPRLQA